MGGDPGREPRGVTLAPACPDHGQSATIGSFGTTMANHSLHAPTVALTAQHTRALDESGYLVIEAALSEGTVAGLRKAFESAEIQVSGTQHVTIATDTPSRAAWLGLERHPLIVAAAAHVLRAPFAAEVHGRNPLPGYGQQGLHADAPPRERMEPYTVLTALWMLDPFMTDNGATRVVPGTHRLAAAIPKRLAQPLAVHPSEVVVCGTAGSVLIFNGHLWHSGRRNDSTRPRRAVQMVLRARGSGL